MNTPSSSSREPCDIIVEFCGSACWKQRAFPDKKSDRCASGSETFANLTGEDVDDGAREADIVVDGLNVTIKNMRRCLHGCGRRPAARAYQATDRSNRENFSAATPQDVHEAVRQVMARMNDTDDTNDVRQANDS